MIAVPPNEPPKVANRAASDGAACRRAPLDDAQYLPPL